jgi:hypothetical protein
MKQIKQTGEWNGEKIWREETAEETLSKHLLVNSLSEENTIPMRRIIDRGYVSDGEGCVEPDYEIKKY